MPNDSARAVPREVPLVLGLTRTARHYNGLARLQIGSGTVGILWGLVPHSCAFCALGADEAEQKNQMLLSDFSGISPGGATWRSGYAAVCKTVYTSSILVVASISQNPGPAADIASLPEESALTK